MLLILFDTKMKNQNLVAKRSKRYRFSKENLCILGITQVTYVMQRTELRNTSSTEKQNIISTLQGRRRTKILNVLALTYNPYLMYGVSSEQCKKRKDLFFGDCEPGYGISQLCHDLNVGRFTGHDAIRIVNAYINKFPEQEELVYCILDKDLKPRAGAKIINKVIFNFIPEFSVALADKYILN